MSGQRATRFVAAVVAAIAVSAILSRMTAHDAGPAAAYAQAPDQCSVNLLGTATRQEADGTIKVAVRATVNRSLAVVRQHLDPRNWVKCLARFESSYFVKDASVCDGGGDQCPSACAPTELTVGAPPGSDLPQSVVFEHVKLGEEHGESEWQIKNLLTVEASNSHAPDGAEAYEFDYKLAKGLCGTTIMGDRRLGVDCGNVTARGEADGSTTVTITKWIAYDPDVSAEDRDMTENGLLHAANAETKDLLCCDNKADGDASANALPGLLNGTPRFCE
jgi:hypothetical protein